MSFSTINEFFFVFFCHLRLYLGSSVGSSLSLEPLVSISYLTWACTIVGICRECQVGISEVGRGLKLSNLS